jgi:Pretoxin HINT domain
MATLRVNGETVRATGGHPFWVVDGEGLAERRLPERISAYEVGGRQPGRWVLAIDLRAGDKILRRDGEVSALESVEVDEVEERVYNFRVFELQNYAVGSCGILVHNTNDAPKSASERLGSLSDNGYGQPYGTPAPNSPRTFSSSDPLVADLANKIEAANPGHVVGVNVPIRNAAGELVTDTDILLQNAAIQVKSGGGKGLAAQLVRTEEATGLPTIGFGPTLKPSVVKNIQNYVGLVTKDEALLLEVVKP